MQLLEAIASSSSISSDSVHTAYILSLLLKTFVVSSCSMDTESVVIEISAVLLSAFTTLFSADKCELSAALFDAQPVSARTIANTYARDDFGIRLLLSIYLFQMVDITGG